MILERSRTWRAVERTGIAIETSVRQSYATRLTSRAADAVRRLPRRQRVRAAASFTTSAAVAYVALASALPVHARPLIPFTAVVLVLLCATAFALPLRE